MKFLEIKTAMGVMMGVATAATLVIAPLTSAQGQPPSEAPAPVEAPPEVRAARTQKLMLTTVVNQMKRDLGVTILIDRSVPLQDVAAPAEAATAETLEAALTALAGTLPKGTVWAKVNLPDRGRAYSPDAVGEYVLAQARLFGGAGAPTPAGTLEVMGQKVTGEKAQAVTAALALKPVYILLNPSVRNAPGSTDPNAANWATMTPEQREQAAQQKAQALLNMTPEQRTGVMQEQMQTMRALMQSMTPEQRQQMFQNMGPGGRGGRGGGGGFGGPRRGQ